MKSPRRFRRARSLPRRLLEAVALVVLLLPRPLLAISSEDQILLEFLIRDLGYYDTASRLLDQLEKKAADKREQADILSLRIDILQRQGKDEEALKLLEELKRKHPDHPRAMGAGLDVIITAALAKVTDALDNAAAENDKGKAAAKYAEASSLFQEAIEKPLGVLITGLDRQIEELKKKAREKAKEDRQKKAVKGPPKADSQLSSLTLSRDKAELARLKIYLMYARKLPPGSPERQQVLEKGAKLARTFVDLRFDFFVMQYDGQLQKGIFAFELGKYDQAFEDLKILFDAEPPGERPFPPDLVGVFKEFRLQALLYGARALNTSRKFDKAADAILKNFIRPRKDEFDLKTGGTATLEQLAVLTTLEYGIALAGTGQSRQGLDEIHKVIKRYKAPGAGAQAEAFVTDARKALGQLSSMGTVQLRGADHYEAAIGLKANFKLEPALEAFQQALSSLNPRAIKEMNEMAPLCLNEIGEVSYMLAEQATPADPGGYVQSALAYQQIARYFGQGTPDFMAKVAKNFLGAASRAVDKTEGGLAHSGLTKIKEEATAFSKKFSEGFEVEQSRMVDAGNLFEQGKYKDAAKRYAEVPPEVKGKRVPFYWRAQSSIWHCVYTEWDKAKDEDKKGLEGEIQKAVKELRRIIPRAIKEKELLGAAKGALTLGQIHYQKGEFPQAVEALKPFRSELLEELVYKCFGLGYLTLAEGRADDLAQAEADYKLIIESDCKDEALAGYVALELSDAFDAAGDAKKAAKYILIYADHPSSEDEMGKLDAAVIAAKRLVRGGYVKDGSRLMTNLAKRYRVSNPSDPELSRQLILFNVRVLAQAKKWTEAIEKLKGYIEKYPPKGEHPDDPYVLRDLAEAYIGRRDPKDPAKDLQEADKWYGFACARMDDRRKYDKTLDPLFWSWVYRYLEIKMMLGDIGAKNSYQQIVDFVDPRKEEDMGALKPKFLKLGQDAEGKLKAATGP